MFEHHFKFSLFFVLSQVYAVWVSDCGYDTRPTAEAEDGTFFDFAPVAHTVEFSHGREGYAEPAGDIRQWMDSLKEGTLIQVPEFSGSHLIGVAVWVKRRGEFTPCYYSCFKTETDYFQTYKLPHQLTADVGEPVLAF